MSIVDRIVKRGSGNVFADLGQTDAERKHLRVRLAVALQHAIAESGLTQSEVAARLNTKQPRISRLLRGHVGEFSVECLERYLDAFGIVVEPRFVPRSRSVGEDRSRTLPLGRALDR